MTQLRKSTTDACHVTLAFFPISCINAMPSLVESLTPAVETTSASLLLEFRTDFVYPCGCLCDLCVISSWCVTELVTCHTWGKDGLFRDQSSIHLQSILKALLVISVFFHLQSNFCETKLLGFFFLFIPALIN